MRERILRLVLRRLLVVAPAIASTSCDPEHRKKCEWYLVPDEDRRGQTKQPFIPVCARNFKTNKQDCRLQATLSYAKKAHNRLFRYVDLETKDLGIPRTVEQIHFCDKGKP